MVLLQKGAGYHLDLFWVAVLIIVCSFTGLPWYVAATVISIAHIDSLKMETKTSAPGEMPKFLGVRCVCVCVCACACACARACARVRACLLA